MRSYQIRLRETRVSRGVDDVASFDVACEGDGHTYHVATILSPLFRAMHMTSQASAESWRDMVGGLGARAVAERLKQGWEPAGGEVLVLATRYPGAPGPPDPLLPYDEVTVCVDGGKHGTRVSELAKENV